MTPRQKGIYISVFVIFGFFISLIYHFYVANFRGLNYYPYNTFLFRPEDRFGDFLDNFNAGKIPYGEIKSSRAMFPFFMLISRLMYLVGHKPVLLAIYSGLFVYCFAIFTFSFLKHESSQVRLLTLCSFLICSYPVLISLDRANFENAVFLLIFLSVTMIYQKNYILSGIIMGIGIALKPYAIFFLPLLLIEGEVVPCILAGFIALSISAISLLLLPVPFIDALATLKINLGLYNETYVIGNEGLYFGTSIFGTIKLITYWLGDIFSWFSTNIAVLEFTNSMMKPYFFITNIFFILIILLLLVYKTYKWKKIAILTSSLTLLPYVGSAYRLLYFFIPILFFITEKKREKSDKFYATLFSLILIPTSYIHFVLAPVFRTNPGEISDSILFQPLIILILLISLLIEILNKKESNNIFPFLLNKIRLELPVQE